MRTNSILFLLILCSANVLGQKLDLNKVTKAELLEKQHKKDTSAPAAIIFKKVKTGFRYTEKDGFTSTTVFQVKLKIFKKEGLTWANFKIPYYVGYKNLDNDFVDIVSGYTYNLEDDKIVKSKVTSQGRFKEQINDNWGAKLVTFPNVKAGSIIELEYKLKTQDISTLPDFQYQYSIPVNYAEYKTEIPAFYIYNGLKRGAAKLDIQQKVESVSQSFQSTADLANVSKTLNFNQVVTNYKAVDVPALQEEDFVNNINNYYGKIEQELQMIQYPNEAPKNISSTWEAVANTIYKEEGFNTAASKFNYFASDVKSLINNLTTDEEKAKKIFDYLKKRMNWNGKSSYYPKLKIEEAYQDKVGNVADINLMLVSMLKMTGIDANPVLLSTRQNGEAPFPNRTLYNYVIVAAQIDGKTILLDATDKYADWNVLPIRNLNGTGRLIKKDGSTSEIDLTPKSNSHEILNIIASITSQGEITGKIREQYSDYNAFVFRGNNNQSTKENAIERLEKKQQGLEIKDYDVQNIEDLSQPVIESYDFTSADAAETIGDKIYVSPFHYFATTENPFKQEYREYPIDFSFPFQDKFSISLAIPDGYSVETLPEPREVKLADNLGGFKYNIAISGNKIQVMYTQEINKAVIDPSYYEALKEFFKEIINKQTEKIVLKKV
jgi:hypothetical protein